MGDEKEGEGIERETGILGRESALCNCTVRFEIGSGWHQKGDEKVRDRDIEYTVGRRKSGTICSHAGRQPVFEIGLG